MQVGAEEFGHEVAVAVMSEGSMQKIDGILPYMSSRGEMKISLSEMTCHHQHPAIVTPANCETHILVLEVLQELQLSICPLRQDWCAERLHYLLNCNILAGELIFGRAVRVHQNFTIQLSPGGRSSYQTSPKAPIPTGCKSEYL